MDRYINGEFSPAATIVIHDLGKITSYYHVFADVPNEQGGFTKMKVTSMPCDTEASAYVMLKEIKHLHPEYDYLRVVKCNKG